jgi:hypothetical protein
MVAGYSTSPSHERGHLGKKAGKSAMESSRMPAEFIDRSVVPSDNQGLANFAR